MTLIPRQMFEDLYNSIVGAAIETVVGSDNPISLFPLSKETLSPSSPSEDDKGHSFTQENPTGMPPLMCPKARERYAVIVCT